MINITGKLHFPEDEDDCMPLRAWPYRYLDSWSRHADCIGDKHWTIAIILAIYDAFTVVVASQA